MIQEKHTAHSTWCITVFNGCFLQSAYHVHKAAPKITLMEILLTIKGSDNKCYVRKPAQKKVLGGHKKKHLSVDGSFVTVPAAHWGMVPTVNTQGKWQLAIYSQLMNSRMYFHVGVSSNLSSPFTPFLAPLLFFILLNSCFSYSTKQTQNFSTWFSRPIKMKLEDRSTMCSSLYYSHILK